MPALEPLAKHRLATDGLGHCEPGAHVAMHYHTSQIVFYILQGTMSVQDQGKPATTFKAGNTLLIRPGTVEWALECERHRASRLPRRARPT
jgi:mannose-6-phosphate isomerase-like protein (cupin superfamily)